MIGDSARNPTRHVGKRADLMITSPTTTAAVGTARMYCNVYVSQLQHAGGLLGYIQRQLGLPIASTAPLAKITDAFSTAMRRFARDRQLPWVDFTKGQRKDDVMHE